MEKERRRKDRDNKKIRNEENRPKKIIVEKVHR